MCPLNSTLKCQIHYVSLHYLTLCPTVSIQLDKNSDIWQGKFILSSLHVPIRLHRHLRNSVCVLIVSLFVFTELNKYSTSLSDGGRQCKSPFHGFTTVPCIQIKRFMLNYLVTKLLFTNLYSTYDVMFPVICLN